MGGNLQERGTRVRSVSLARVFLFPSFLRELENEDDHCSRANPTVKRFVSVSLPGAKVSSPAKQASDIETRDGSTSDNLDLVLAMSYDS